MGIVPLGYIERRRRWLNIVEHDDACERDGIVVCRIEAPLFYANIESAQEWLAEEEGAANDRGNPLHAIILSAACMPFVDTTAAQGLRQLIEAYQKRNVRFLIANAHGEVAHIIRRVMQDLLPKKPYDLAHT